MPDPIYAEADPKAVARLRALFETDAPPLRDTGFTRVAMAAIARRRFWLEILAMLPWLVAASAALWAFGPLLMRLGGEAALGLTLSAPLGQGLAIFSAVAAMLLGLIFLVPAHERRL